jgi:hypothetical protein
MTNYFEQFIATAFYLTFFLYVLLMSFYGALGFRDFFQFKWPRDRTTWRDD